MSITASAPFAGTQDQSLAVAYVSAFILVFFVSSLIHCHKFTYRPNTQFTLFPFGGHRMIAWDFIGPDVENDDARKSSIEKRRRLFKIAHRLLRILGRQTSSKSFPSQVNGERIRNRTYYGSRSANPCSTKTHPGSSACFLFVR